MPEEYTIRLHIWNEAYDIEVMVKDGTDVDGWFPAWCLQENEPIEVCGYLFNIEECEHAS